MLFSELASYLSTLEKTAARLEMTVQLAGLFAKLSPAETTQTCYLLQGSLVPAYESLEFQLSTKMVLRVLARVLEQRVGQSKKGAQVIAQDLFGQVVTADDVQLEKVTSYYQTAGDLGATAEWVMEHVSSQEGAGTDFSIAAVFAALTVVAKASGAGSQEQKVALLTELFQNLSPLPARFVARIVLGKLRLGFATMTMLDALSWAVVGDKSETKLLELAYQRRADVGTLAADYLQWRDLSPAERAAQLEKITIAVGVPIVPALCQRLNTAQEIIEKMNTVYVEPKYDGLRIQIHIDKKTKTIKAFTRNLEAAEHMFPELERAFELLAADSVILDAEAIGYNPATGELVTFQETTTRRRKHDVTASAEKTPIRFYIFDVLAKDGESYLQQSLQVRKDLLKKLFKQNEVFYETPYIITSDPEELRSYHEQQLELGLEGAVIKQQNSEYQSGRKGWSWVKIKEAEGTAGKLSDTLDLVVIGYYYGRGKRAQFGMGAVLLGLRGEGEQFLTVAKLGTGLTEAELVVVKEMCDEYPLTAARANELYNVPKGLVPDVWVEPNIVLEVAADEITTSPLHTAGVALRFPRLVKIRTDKNAEQATTLGELNAL
jgi:DNA ligase-1